MDQIAFSQNNKEFYFQWHITDKCNLRCAHCYQDDYTDNSDLPLEELKLIADKLFRTLSKWKKKGDISITGGEPFTRRDLFSFLEYLDTSKCVSNLDILSNGTILTNENVERLRSLNKLHSVQISLDGASPETHNEIRGHGNIFNHHRVIY